MDIKQSSLLNLHCCLQPVICDGPIDGWLTTLINTIKQTLTEQLFTVINTTSSNQPNEPLESDTDKTVVSEEILKPFLSMENCCQVVLLAIQVQWCRKVEDAVGKAVTGDKTAVNEALGTLTGMVSSLAKRLRGAEIDEVKDGRQTSTSVDGNIVDEYQEGKKSRNTSVTPDRTPSAIDIDGRSDISGSSGRGADKNESIPTSDNKPDKKVSNLQLTPSQLQKMSNLITILSHKRELMQQLVRKFQEGTDIQSMNDWFAWMAHARYSCTEDRQTCKTDILDMEFEYGFEYQGTVSRLAISPFTDKCLVGLAKGMKANAVGLCTGVPVSTHTLIFIAGYKVQYIYEI